MIKLLALNFLLIPLIIGCGRQRTPSLLAQEKWTYEDRAQYAKDRLDATKWDLGLLKDDIEDEKYFKKEINLPTKSAISSYPSPVPVYDWGYSALYRLNLEIEGKLLKGNSVSNAADKYRVLEASNDYFITKFNILILTDLLDDEQSSNTIISRNYPHYMSTGKQKTTQGEIDWVQMDMADGSNFAIINQRYFDLEFGRTIIVIPQKDCSLRFLQLETSIESFAKSPTNEEIEMTLEKFYEQLRSIDQLSKLLQSAQAMEQTSD